MLASYFKIKLSGLWRFRGVFELRYVKTCPNACVKNVIKNLNSFVWSGTLNRVSTMGNCGVSVCCKTSNTNLSYDSRVRAGRRARSLSGSRNVERIWGSGDGTGESRSEAGNARQGGAAMGKFWSLDLSTFSHVFLQRVSYRADSS